MWLEIKRKLFHLTALIYVVGIIYLPRVAYLFILAGVLLAVLSVEVLRLNIPTVGEWFQRRFGGLFREEERTRFSGVMWMLLGVLVTCLITRPVPLAVAALLYLILGDATASLVGKRLGGPHWPKSNKRVSGSLACFVTCLVIGLTVLRPDYGWHGVVVGAAVATVLEWGLVPINDNLTIPVGSALALSLSYRVGMFAGLL